MSTTYGGLILPVAGETITATGVSGISTNFQKVLNNQAGATAPTGPVTGQEWYDTGTSTLKLWNGSAWVTTGGGGGGATGATGISGYSGVIGATGVSGFSGASTGVPGSTGATGATGAPGATGLSGYSGAVGATGANSGAPQVLIVDYCNEPSALRTVYLDQIGNGLLTNVPFSKGATGAGIVRNTIGVTAVPNTQTGTGPCCAPLSWETYAYVFPAGTYYVTARVPVKNGNSSGAYGIISLCNATTNAVILDGTNINLGDWQSYDFCLDGTFTLASTTTLVIRMAVYSGALYWRDGAYTSYATQGIFSSASFWQIS